MNRERREKLCKCRKDEKNKGENLKSEINGNPNILEYIESLERRIENLEELHNLDI